MPADADCVILQEDVAREGDSVTLVGEGPQPPDKHVRRAGLDFRSGEEVLAAGTRLGPAQLALAQAGRGTRLSAHAKHTGTPHAMKIFRFRGGIHPEGNKDPTACHPIPDCGFGLGAASIACTSE